MLPAYGVLIGTYQSFTREQGQWMHVDMTIEAGTTAFQAAVDVNEPTGIFQYVILSGLDAALFAAVAALPDGWHALAPSASSGAIDYARSPIFLNAAGQSLLTTWNNVTGDEAGNALVAMVQSAAKCYVFGAPYSTGNGVHDVHCNQGDPAGPFQSLDGIWQDGCVFTQAADGTLSAYLGKFSSQTLVTGPTGLPV